MSSLLLLLMSFLPSAIGCSAAAPKPPAPVRKPVMGAGIPLSQFSVEVVIPGGNPSSVGSLRRGDVDSGERTADLNDGPIHVWIAARAAHRAEAIYMVGRADAACNLRISGFLEDIANDPAFKSAWITYGVSLIRAADLSQQQRLGELGEKLANTTVHEDCSGQVKLHRLRADEIHAASEKMHKLAGKVFQSAERVGRPILLWHNAFDGLPRFVPVAMGADGAPLTIHLSLEELKIPNAVLRGLTLDGMTRQIGHLEAEVEHVELVLDLLRPGGQYPKRIVYKGSQFNDTAIPEIRSRIVAARTNIERALEYEEQAIEATLLLGRAPSRFVRFADSLRHARAENQHVLERLDHIASGSDVHEVVFGDVEFAAIDTTPSAGAVKILEGQRETLRAKIAQAKGAEKKRLTSPIPVLVDAFLRGWPASFDSRETNEMYDRWILAQQEKVWDSIEKKLSQAGITFSKASHSLLLSNVMFHARLSEDERSVLVTPTYVMSGPGFQVADVRAGVVRYESASAEQNLIAR
ncbi:hypothetical protein [Polyangium jinanense]|uniref:Uncharacterized protein n=1 Tax=Polyangium jinanense TaxID=2829994 RepID=A0A9X3X826_9BACT|nr:hypothetical protein [Polyangium jinanense]MDC3960903.1 hypothetical protein [Polyangium jinanense]MDC3984490.1 hypothetical protein [Polyangium jinanense]